MDVALDGRLQQKVALAENPIGRLADGREHDAAVGDRARAVDDEADETGGDQDQAEGPGNEPKHDGLGESPLRRGTRSRRAAQGAFRRAPLMRRPAPPERRIYTAFRTATASATMHPCQPAPSACDGGAITA